MFGFSEFAKPETTIPASTPIEANLKKSNLIVITLYFGSLNRE
jgi:hypothetical protein